MRLRLPMRVRLKGASDESEDDRTNMNEVETNKSEVSDESEVEINENAVFNESDGERSNANQIEMANYGH